MEGHLHIPIIPRTSSGPASTSSAMFSHSLPQQSNCWVSPHPWLMEEELLLNDSSAANPKFRSSASGALPAPWVPGDWAWRARGDKSPEKEEPMQVLFLKADI